MSDPERPEASTGTGENVRTQYEQDKLLIRRALEAFNAYSFCIKGTHDSSLVNAVWIW